MESTEPSQPKLNKYGRRYIIWMFIWPFFQLVLFWAIAQRMDFLRLWIYFAVNILVIPAGILIVACLNPDVLNHRAQWRKKEGIKTWDKVWIRFFGAFAFSLPIITAALDIGRYHWTRLGFSVTVLGIVLFITGNAIFCWALCVNRFFETMVRLQTDRRQTVITTGPYQYVRHPGYVGVILWILSTPLILGSAVALIPAVIACLLLIVRTYIEDNMLQKQLPGYSDYAARVRYRLIWGIW
jgi:protein-S-isoprenylcysteine O-methyltransferase Ste14